MSWLTPIKLIGGPGSLGLLALILAASVLVHWKIKRPWLRRSMAAFSSATVALYLVLALPIVALAITSRLPAIADPAASRISDIQTLVIFAGDNFDGRARKAADILRRANPPARWLLGPDYLLDELETAGFPLDGLRRDDGAVNTSAQIAQVQALASWTPTPIAIVASRVQMPRIAGMVSRAGLDVILIPAPFDREPASTGAWRLVPSYGALMASRDAIYELAALRYYRWHGALPSDVP